MEIISVVLASVGTAGLLVLVLVGLLVYAKEKLIPSGDISLIINGNTDDPVIVQPGSTLLGALNEQNVYLPSACGGGGTCAMCKCQVLDGGGEVLPTEAVHLTRKEQKENWRLGCQVKVKQDMTIKVPEEIFGIKKWECEVISNENVATFIKEFVVRLPEGESLDFESGGYIQVDVPPCDINFKEFEVQKEYHEDWDGLNVWDLNMISKEEVIRAYSMANHPAEGNIIKLNIRIATPPWDRNKGGWADLNPGVCSSYIFNLKAGDKVTVSGPYGEFFIKETESEMVYIGGGAGMAPLRSHLFHLFHTLKTGRKVSFWYGGRSAKELFYTEEFRAIEEAFPNFTYHLALSEPKEEDNWDGPVGFIHQVVLDNYLSKHEEPEEIEYYMCGPGLMLKACNNMLEELGVPEEKIAFDDFG
ncbi:MAG: NADH:ubiquinone reductase (Na(+)-transporting) subunit F [Rhodothermales bacterium]|jgi:Na+-transporting NADH:ubiquinone oxidoreductase subunit F|nr:NADH:ubiquinone reductase (Na(+)-transporting) subunit F [Rhodothermales bacterium]MDG2016957.1 NADH:ubiquinone reductase (Na(+)-transporting) subunit F [Rhodothermales bacterium]